MEVEEENTINHLHESTTTTVSNERLLENNCSNDNELGKEVSESNTEEEKGKESSVIVPKLDDPNPFVAVAVGETAEDKEVTVQCGNSESGRCWNSAVVESTTALKDEKDGEEGDVKDEITTGDVAAVEHGESELTSSDKVDDGECQAVVIVRDNGLNVVVENVKNSVEDTNTDGSLVIEDVKDGGEGELETVMVEEDVEVLKDGGGVDVPSLPVTGIAEREEVMTDVKNDVVVDTQKENVEIVIGEEEITEDQDDFQEGMDAKVLKEKGIVADEEDALGVGEGIEEEGKMADEEKAVSVTENDEEEPMVADEEKSLDTELETDEEATMADEEKVPDAEVMETELLESSPKSTAGKRKRGGRNSKTTSKPKAGRRKMTEEDVCFICFDGGDLVLCDRRNCPKAYHPSCVNRDEAFFQTKGQWNCGWHLCSICEKKAEYMCYTCTFSLCKACIKTNIIFCVREKEKKGLCEACMKTVMLIEKNSEENQGNVDFDDKSSWEYLFKDYWTDMKAKLDLTLSELVEAKNAWKGSELSGKQEPPAAHSDVKDDGGSGSENPSENLETRKNRRRKAKKRKSATKEEEPSTGAAAVASEGTSVTRNTEWASKELLEFVMHMGDGNISIRSQFDVQALLLEYIKTNNLRDSRRKSQIICDARLERLFGKPRVGHFEMLKLLESHFLIKEDHQIDDIQGSVVDTEVSHVDDDEANETVAKGGKDRKRKMRKKGDREPQSNREDYAAIDIHNISLIYLRRKLVEDLLDDTETFHSKVIGTFVRIRISGANLKQDIYRLVQVTGTTKAAQYALGKKMTNTMLEILNLNKTESISIDTISNQDFTEDECKRLRQSIKCGLITRLTVGDILDKAMELQAARVNDWLETEVLRLSHLRDRASDLGRKKELRECVEKLQLLKTPEERARKLEEFPIIHVDPTMDPNCGSEDDTDEEEKKQDMYKSSVGSRFSRRREYPSKESWSGTGTSRSSGKNYEFSRSLSNNNFSNKTEDAATSARFEPHNESLRDQGRDTSVQQPSILKKPSSAYDEVASTKDITGTASKVNETEKMWHYKDPSGKIQGPFSMAQLRKWSNNKYFPADLRIWMKSEKEDDGILLTDALEGRFTLADHSPRLQSSHVNWATTSVEIPKPSPDERPGFANLPSPTPNQSITGLGPQVGPHIGPSSYHSGKEELQSPTPNSSQLATSFVAGGNKELNAMGSFGNSSTFVVAAAPQTEQLHSLQSSQSGHVVAPPANNMPSQMVQPAAGQNLPVGPYGWSGGPPQPSLSSNLAVQQQLAYNQWGNAPNMVQNSAGNFLPQAPAPVNLQQAPPPPPPPQSNVSWPTLPANPNMGVVGPTPGNQVMNWGPTAQNPPLTGNVNPPWAGNMHPGWVPPPPAQGVAPNQGWVPGPGPGPTQVPIVSGNGNPNWVGPPGNQGAPLNPGEVAVNQRPSNPNTGWTGGPGNQGNSNQGWGSASPRNRAMWDDRSGQKRNRGGGGYGGNRRQWDKGGSFNNRGRSRDSA
ncbi:zinc finger CCCH domain-containing protein 19-like [Cynara cardunculus var. scolymus]|uniref:zinc finger CCCH domain-containing protein 19-like n=1 Tax=Cynara cardunculus var. scolymus TaxID=59895 RepID=UPI000D62532F|nr:zinc finger CCCH domain-containing protein 19-like [Cynara cardunculus var. scolymus]